MPRKEGYKKKGKSKKSDVGTRAYVVKDPDGKKLDGDRVSRYQVVGKTKEGNIKLEIVVDKYGYKQGIGASKIEVSPERWNIQFAIARPKNLPRLKTRKKKAGEAGKTVMRKGQGGGKKKVQGRAAAKIQRAVRRRLKGVKKKRAEQVAKEELVAPELRGELGKTTGAHPIGFNVEVVGTGQKVFEPVSKEEPHKVKKGGYWIDEEGDTFLVTSSTPGATYVPEYEKSVISGVRKGGRESKIFGESLPLETKLKIATARVGNKQLVMFEDEDNKMIGGSRRAGITRGDGARTIDSSSYFIRDGYGKGLHKLMWGYSNWVANYVITLKDVKGEGKRQALTEKELGKEVQRRTRDMEMSYADWQSGEVDDPKFYRNLLRADRLHGFASTYNYNKASKEWRERGGSNK